MAGLDDLKRRLYQTKEQFSERMRAPDITDSGAPAIDRVPPISQQPTSIMRRVKKSKKIWIVFVVVVFATAALFLYGTGVFEFQNVDIKISGPQEIASGERVTWTVQIKNNNTKDLENVAIVFSIPDVMRERVKLETIKSGQTFEQEFSTIVFGGRGTELEATATLEYRPVGSSAFFTSGDTFLFSIARSPVTVSFKMPEELRAGQETTFTVRYVSQASETISDLFLEIDFPVGFEMSSSNPSPDSASSGAAAGEYRWQIGTLDPAVEGSILITGTIVGEVTDTRRFAARLGPLEGDRVRGFDETIHTVVLRSPFLGVDMRVKGEKKYIAQPGESISVEIPWQNNVPEKVSNAEMRVSLAGSAIDRSTIRVPNGSYLSSSDAVVWAPSTYEKFREVLPGSAGEVRFSFRVRNDFDFASETAGPPMAQLAAQFSSLSPVPGFEDIDISGSAKLDVVIASALQLSARALYFDSLIPNTGPLPPRVGAETTYTIVWSLANTLNDLAGVVVRSTIPPYVSYKNIVSPAGAPLSFDAASGELIWRVGNLAARTGFAKQALSVSFQIGVVPAENQVGTSPVIVGSVEASGADIVVDALVSDSENQTTTNVPDDPRITAGMKKVVQ